MVMDQTILVRFTDQYVSVMLMGTKSGRLNERKSRGLGSDALNFKPTRWQNNRKGVRTDMGRFCFLPCLWTTKVDVL